MRHPSQAHPRRPVGARTKRNDRPRPQKRRRRQKPLAIGLGQQAGLPRRAGRNPAKRKPALAGANEAVYRVAGVEYGVWRRV